MKPQHHQEQDQQQIKTIETYQLPTCQEPAPEALPIGWVVRHSISNPGYMFYFHQESGICQWDNPINTTTLTTADNIEDIAAAVANVFQQPSSASVSTSLSASNNSNTHLNLGDVLPSASSTNITTQSTKRQASSLTGSNTNAASDAHTKKQKVTSSNPTQVRVLHILKKHKDSRKPKSWRNPNISITKYQAMQELQEIISILDDVKNDPKELRATFEELAKTESDCSSAKRGGDLGYFGRKKMQPAFEKASFALNVGQLSDDIVDTSSGVHVILRLG